MPTSLVLVLGLMVALTLAGVPIAFGFAFAAFAGLIHALGGVEPALNLVQQTAVSGIKEYNLVVIPLFTAMGMLIAYSGAAQDLFAVVNRRLGRIPGRLAIATVGGNTIFAAVTGVGIAAAAAFSRVAYPAMQASGYGRPFATGCIAGSAVLGLLIPPSVLMIVWGVLTEQSVGRLFAAGLLPGLVLAAAYAAYCYLTARLNPEIAPDLKPGLAATTSLGRDHVVGWLGVLLLVAVVLGGIWLGFFTPTEGAAVGMFGAIGLAFAKGMTVRRVVECFLEAGRTTTPILFLMACAVMYTKLLVLEGIPDVVKDLLTGWGLGPDGSLLFMVVVWFLLGCLIDSISIMLLTVPVFWPIAQSFGLDPIAFALIGILVIEAGILTPPFGLGCFVVKAAVPDPEVTIRDVFVGAAPYWLLILGLALAIHLFPPLATWLPTVL